MEFKKRYAGLNAAQKQAVDATEGPVMVIAGPGTGKTELLSMRAANILRRTDVLPQNILCLTFTDSGAAAMRQRLLGIIGPSAYKVAIHTFHSFGTEIINQNGQFFYNGASFQPADELTCYEILRGIFDQLDHTNPLGGKMNDEYTHLRDTLSVISELKKSGLTHDELLTILDANHQAIEAIEPQLADIFAARISKATRSQLQPLPSSMRGAGGEVAIPGITPLGEILADSLEHALAEAEATNSTKPLTAWRSQYMKKDEHDRHILKARASALKLRAVASVYEQYLLRMQAAEAYDFDDMILRVVHAAELFPELRFNLQEQYQYIMVDEFQDTNLAQMRILHSLTASEDSTDAPNIMVVGDDDQAIYSFQGADVGNIHAFSELFPAVQRIVLTDNYRSAAPVLQHARAVIAQCQTRLETLLPNLDKTLTPHHTPAAAEVELVELPDIHEERAWLARAIAKTIAGGTPVASIAVLARRHREIEALLPYFAAEQVPVQYDRQDNILDLEVIRLIEQLAQLLVALYEQRHDDANTLLPQIVAHPAFGMTPIALWKLSLQAYQNRTSWLEAMAATPALQPLQEWLVTQAQSLAYTPLEPMLDRLIGRHDSTEGYTSPLAAHFFSPRQLEANPEAYLIYLGALQTLRTHLTAYEPGEIPTLQALVEFLRMHRQLGSRITSTRTTGPSNGVHLMTAHKSKGLEFDTVYITGAIDNSWGERVRSRSRLISYPDNLPLAPAGDTYDERLRLFFVAATRARNRLVISYGASDGNNKPTAKASFLNGEPWQPHIVAAPASPAQQLATAQTAWWQPLTNTPASQQEVLAPLLANYKLSATHLCAFLDVTRGGPQAFLIEHLLHFPHTKPPQAAYGSAIHAALQRAHAHVAATGNQRPLEDSLHDYEAALARQHLTDDDFQLYLQKGSSILAAYLEARAGSFHASQKAELSFANQAVQIGEARLTGMLDLVDTTPDGLIITDYKTGRPARSWQGRDDYEKIKLHRYKQQLMFYWLMAANSRDYARHHIAQARLQFVEPTPRGEIVALEARFGPEDLQRFARLIEAVWQRITALDLPDSSQYSADYAGVLAFEAALVAELPKEE